MTQPPDQADPTTFWDAKFEGQDYKYGTRPNAFLVDQSWRLKPESRVLAPGDGEGRNGVWLAEQGHSVVTVDASPRGIQKATKLALDRGVRLNASCADLRDWAWPTAVFDVVVATFLHLAPTHRLKLHQSMVQALVPGGLVLLEAFTPDQLKFRSGGPKAPELLYAAEHLRTDFKAAEILELEETETVLAEGPYHEGTAAVVRLVARRPVV